MIIFDEQLADILDDGNARRGWFMDVRREQDEELIRKARYCNCDEVGFPCLYCTLQAQICDLESQLVAV